MAETGPTSYDGFLSYSHAADGLLAPRLQAGLQRFAKPWWKRRALRVFRDEASLSANPHLWSSITDALDDSEWFVLLLSPDAAQSEWVNREIDYWKGHRDPQKILPVVTDGTFGWSGGDVAGDAVPESLLGVFGDEPRWVDVRFARTETQLDLRHTKFRDAVADIAAAIRGVAKDELESEEIRQHRRTVRTAWTGGIAIIALGVAAMVGAVVAFNAQQDAQDERDKAVAAELTATAERDRANQETDRANLLADQEAAARAEAEEQARIAQANAELARSRELAASAINVLDDDPELSVLLALEAAKGAEPAFESVSALHEALQRHRAIRTIYWPEEWAMDPGLLSSISPDGRLMAVTGARHQLAVWDLESRSSEPLWLFEVPWPNYAVITPYFTTDSARVVASVAWFNRDEPTEAWPDPPDEVGIYVLDARDGSVVNHVRGPECPPLGLFQDGPFIDDERLVGAGVPSAYNCSIGLTADLWLVDLVSGETISAHDEPVFTWNWGVPASMSSDGQRLAFAAGTSSFIVDTELGEVVLERPGGWYAMTTRDGSKLLAAGERTIGLWEVDSGKEIWTINAPLALNDPRFNEDETLLLAGAHDGMVRIWDATSGIQLHELKGHLSYSWSLSMTVDRNNVASASGDGAVRIWDLSASAEGEIAGFSMPGASVLQSGKVVDGRGAILRYADPQSALAEPGTAVLFDVSTGQVESEFADVYGGYLVRLSPDESLLAGQPFSGAGELGPVHIRRVDGGEVVTILEDLCTYDLAAQAPGADCTENPGAKADEVHSIDFSPDGSMIAVGGADIGIVGVWDVATGERLTWLDVPPVLKPAGAFVQFSPTGDILIGATSDIIGFSVADWTEIGRFPIDWAWFDAQFTRDGSLLVGSDSTRGEITTVDTTTWRQVGPSLSGHEGTVRDIDLSEDGSLIASAGSDGYVLIWNREKGSLLQSIPVGSSVTLVDFINDRHLLVIPEGRPAMVMTIDVGELVGLAREQITRSFTADECATYHLDPCPDLETIRGG